MELSSAAVAAKSQQLLLKRKTLQAVLDQCQRALQSIQDGDDEVELDDAEDSSAHSSDSETEEICDLLQSKFETHGFLQKLGSVHASVSQFMPEEGNSWDMVSENDLWDGENIDGTLDSEQEGYVLLKHEDIVDAIACFMAAQLLSLEETKELTPNQLQEALCKIFSVKKKKGRLQKAWDGSKVVYNVASWGATAIGIYQNPALLRAASVAFWSSCNIISKLL